MFMDDEDMTTPAPAGDEEETAAKDGMGDDSEEA